MTIAKEEGPSALWKGLEPGVQLLPSYHTQAEMLVYNVLWVSCWQSGICCIWGGSIVADLLQLVICRQQTALLS